MTIWIAFEKGDNPDYHLSEIFWIILPSLSSFLFPSPRPLYRSSTVPPSPPVDSVALLPSSSLPTPSLYLSIHVLQILRHRRSHEGHSLSKQSHLPLLLHRPAGDPPRHHPPTLVGAPGPRHIAALLAFDHGSCVAIATCIFATLAARLHSTHNPVVALKSLLALHHIHACGAFILCDQLPAALLRQLASGCNPLALPASAFPSTAFPLASWARWLARLLELLLVTTITIALHPC